VNWINIVWVMIAAALLTGAELELHVRGLPFDRPSQEV
jgi:hypothetical protein